MHERAAPVLHGVLCLAMLYGQEGAGHSVMPAHAKELATVAVLPCCVAALAISQLG
jgi:hypothetical protein